MKTRIIQFSLLVLLLPAICFAQNNSRPNSSSYGAWQSEMLRANRNHITQNKNTMAHNNVSTTQSFKTKIIIPAAEAEQRGLAIERQQAIDRLTGADKPQAKGWTDSHGNTRPLTEELIDAEKTRLEKSKRRNKSDKIRKLEENPSQYFYDEEVRREEARSTPPSVTIWR
jgi:hypothetical protein